jgi:hypothetical protein
MYFKKNRLKQLNDYEAEMKTKSIDELGGIMWNTHSDEWKITYKVMCDKKGKEYPRWLKQWLATL